MTPSVSNVRDEPNEEIERLCLLCALDRARLQLLMRRRSLASRSVPHVLGAGMRLAGMIPGPFGKVVKGIQYLDTLVGPYLRRLL